MPIVCTIDDSRLRGFSPQAIGEVQTALQDYRDALITEISHIEQIRRRSASGVPEITGDIVKDATQLLQRGFRAKPIQLGVKLVRISAAVLSLIVGMMYDKAELQSQIYMIVFVLVISLAIMLIMLSVIKE